MTELAHLWEHRDPHILHTRVQAGDIDGLNHTNNAVYVNWCEQVAWAHSVALGLDLERYRALDRAMVITHSEFDYLQASREGDEIAVATWIVEWDQKTHYGDGVSRSFDCDDEVTLLRAGMRFACVELSSGRPRRLPPAFIAGYGPAVREG